MSAAPKVKNAAALREVLNQWEKGSVLAPLGPAQGDAIIDLAAHADERALPDLPPGEAEYAKVVATDAGGEAPHSLVPGEGSRPAVIENSQQFLSWFQDVETQMESDQERSFRAYLELLQQYRARCDAMLAEIGNALNHLSELESYYTSVSAKTGSLHEACEQLLQDQTNLANYAESVSSRLSYFNELDRLTQKLTAPSLSVLNEQFVPLLSRLDECIKYISEHGQYKDAPAFLVRFTQLQGRGLNLVKLHVINTLKMATQNVQTQVQGAGDGADASFTLFYGKFRLHAPRIKALMVEIERRSLASAEYAALLRDCHECYFSQRLALLRPVVVAAVQDMVLREGANLPALVRSGCAYMAHLCNNEHQLYHHFFSSMSPGLFAMLEQLSTILYEACRPLFITTSVSLDTLVELCVVLKAEALEDRDEEVAAFASVAEQMLQDVQERLVFVSQSYTLSEIRNFDPEPTDLNYPERLQNALPGSDQKALYATWYSTLPRALLLLSKLSRCVNKGVFDGMAQEIVSACLVSLRLASRWISIKKGPAHGQLFLVKHLILLREQTAPFEIDVPVTEISLDFTQMREAAMGLLRKGTFSLHLDSFVNLLSSSAPHVTENKLDFRKEVDDYLRESCQEFIKTVSKRLTAPLVSLLVQVDALPDETKKSLSQQPFATAEKLREIVKETDQVLQSELKVVVTYMSVYLANKDTERILFRPIKAAVLETYAKFGSLLMAAYTPEDRAIVACPSLDQITLTVSLDGGQDKA